MSVFSDCLGKIRDRRKLSNTQVANLCGLEKTVVYRWFSGQRMPESWEKVAEKMENLHLSPDERGQLKEAYRRSFVGEENYEVYQSIIEVFKRLAEQKSTKGAEDIVSKYQLRELPETQLLKGREEIAQNIENLFISLAAGKKKQFYFKIQSKCKEAMAAIKIFSRRNPDSRMEGIIYMNNDLMDSKVHNMDLFLEVISLQLLECESQIYYAEATDRDGKFASNWIFSDEYVLQFNDDLTFGMMNGKKEWVEFFREDFFRIRDVCRPVAQKQVNPTEYIQEMIYQDSDLVGIEFMPCFGRCLTEKILREFIYEDLPGREELIQSILRIFVTGGEVYFPKSLTAFFLPAGLEKFMETGVLDIFPYQVYRPLDKKARCFILERAIRLSEQGTVVQYMLRESMFPNLEGIHVEQVHGQVESLTFDRRFQGELKDQIQIKESRILNEFWQFFQYLKESEYVYTEEETREFMRKVLKQYRD